MTFDPNRLIAIIGKQAAEIEELRIVLKRLLLNYGAALPEGQKDQRSIAEARKLLGIDEQSESKK